MALTVKGCEAEREIGRHSDGRGLYLNIAKGGSKSWIFLWTQNGRRREAGLGGFPVVTLAEARERADEYRKIIARGGDPIAERKKATTAPTFKKYAHDFIAKEAKNFRNAKHIAQWKMTIDRYAKPLHDKPLDEIATADVMEALEPIWSTLPETAKRTQGRIERILDRAKAEGLRTGENPARYRGHLKELGLKKRTLQRGHHPAMPYQNVPAFVAKLQERKSVSALALEFTILCAARTGETIGAVWSEFDLDAALWSIPADRMKAHREHTVPLSPRVVTILKELRGDNEPSPESYVFPGAVGKRKKTAGGLSNMAMAELLKGLAPGFTVHGMRSAFRDWAGDETDYPRELAETALAHAIGNATERSYRRGTALARRREMMSAWADFVAAVPSEDVQKAA